MEEKIYKEFLNNEDLKVLTLEEIINKIKELGITSIALSVQEFYRNENGVVKILKTDYEHPFTIEDRFFSDGKRLNIDPDWYIQNQAKVDQLIRYIINNATFDNMTIYSGCLVNDKLVDSICGNKNLKFINLGSEINPYILNQTDYVKFKSSSVEKVRSTNVDSSLTENFDKIVGYNSDRPLINSYTYEALNPKEEKTIYFSSDIKEEEINNIKYINNNIIFQLTDEAVFEVIKISNRLKQLNKNNKIIINVKDKNKFNHFIASNDIQYNNVFIGFGNSSIPLDNYIRFEKMLYQMIESAKDLSPFEKYIYAYNITKQFKKYKENDEDRMKARKLYDILMNEYMVCVGYSNMIGDFLDKLGIPNIDLSVGVDISYDGVDINSFKPEEKVVEIGGHARRYVYIQDEKYNINGFYISDPTWDNDLENDYYNHLIMTDYEATTAKRYLHLTQYSKEEVFNSNTIEEYYSKIRFLLRNDKIDGILWNLLEIIEKLDIKYYNELNSNEKFKPFFEDDNLENVNELVYELGNYILKRTNKTVSADTIMNGVEAVYRHSYGYSEEELQKKLIEVREENRIRQNKFFPKRYSEYEDGRIEVYSNEINKFDTEETVNKVM